MNNRYEIRTLADFIAIPSEKREHCLHDFALWCDVIERAVGLEQAFGGVVKAQTDTFVWLDDGKHDMNVRIDFKGDA